MRAAIITGYLNAPTEKSCEIVLDFTAINLIELMYYCLVLGYMGKYQVLNNGKVSIENIKKELEKIIRQYGSGQSAELLLNNENKNKFHLLINSLKKLDEPYVYFKEDFLQKLNYEKIQKNYNQF